MKVSLVSWTNDPILTMMYAFSNMHYPIPHSLEEFKEEALSRAGSTWDELSRDFMTMMSYNPHSSVLEFVNMVFYIEGGSRAFQQQLTRTRLASYSIQSLRIVSPGRFYDEGLYHVPPRVRNDEQQAEQYEAAMETIQDAYTFLIDNDFKVEDARGVLPLNITSPITISINLRSFMHTAEMRLCHLTQGEYREAAMQMIEEVKEKMSPHLGVLFSRPCEKLDFCPMPIHCNVMAYKQKEVYKSVGIERWLKG